MRDFGKHYGLGLPRLGQVLLLIFLCLLTVFVRAAEPIEQIPVSPLSAEHANWVFSGSVANEAGDVYEYFFQVKRNGDALHAMASLIDAQSKAVIFMEDAQTQLSSSQPESWEIGTVFLRYNAINSSWIFGLNKSNKIGFNFKVDMLNQSDHEPVSQHLHQGVQMVVVQTGQVNGHMQLVEDGPAQFVSGKNAWFRQIVFSKSQVPMPGLQGLLCRFQDGSALYSMKMSESDATQGALSGLYSAEGASLAISQFIHVDHSEAGPWRVNVPYPKLQFELSHVLQHQAITLGFMTQKEKQGFCVISEEGSA